MVRQRLTVDDWTQEGNKAQVQIVTEDNTRGKAKLDIRHQRQITTKIKQDVRLESKQQIQTQGKLGETDTRE